MTTPPPPRTDEQRTKVALQLILGALEGEEAGVLAQVRDEFEDHDEMELARLLVEVVLQGAAFASAWENQPRPAAASAVIRIRLGHSIGDAMAGVDSPLQRQIRQYIARNQAHLAREQRRLARARRRAS